ncbi:MAG: ABC transporter permease [Clostridiales bacterium]|nr:ABC transporter permease [Clostridiales bacterium]
MIKKDKNSLNEALKRREQRQRDSALIERDNGNGNTVLALDDTQRVKILSPGRLVSKRFFRNRLAMVGLCILIAMFILCFLCPIFYPYSQTQIFYKYDLLNVNYASATERTEYVAYTVDKDLDVHYSVLNRINTYISQMESEGLTELFAYDPEGSEYSLSKLGERVYKLSANELLDIAEYHEKAVIGTYTKLGDTFTWRAEAMDGAFQTAARDALAAGVSSFTYKGENYTITEAAKNKYDITRSNASVEYIGQNPGSGFDAAFGDTVASGQTGFEFSGVSYRLRPSSGGYVAYTQGGQQTAVVASTYVFDPYEAGLNIPEGLKSAALLAVYDGGSFEYDGETFSIRENGEHLEILDPAGKEYAVLSTYSIRRYSGQDTLDLQFKDTLRGVIEGMEASGKQTAEFVYSLPTMDEEANYVRDENGSLTYSDATLVVNRMTNQYVVICEQTTYLIDIFGRPSAAHWLGTDGDGMDILARAMYGGRISLMVGFVVVLLEMFLGIILGGLAGFFGGWVDTLIMRLVDIFYCIPSLPILIIMGALFDAQKLEPYVRLIWLMAILGFLGWAGVARLVRGQILSLREQEFMVAEEATGMRANKRIFRHLVPNVMPQLIVSATMGLGSVIITESTLSFLGLGVKHPLATWGNMINSVTGSSEDMIRYTYIWIPIGLLICLAVIAFNFVGDGLRDAYDPKMKQ